MRISIPEKLANSINTIRKFCQEAPSCEECPFSTPENCLFVDIPSNFPVVEETKAYFIEVDKND